VKPIGVKITALFCALIAVAFLVSCKPAAHTNVSSRSQQLASESAAAYNAKDFAKAQALAAEATSTDPQFAEAWVGYGMASVRLGQTDLARQAYERALALHQTRHRQNPSDANQVVQQIFLLKLLGKPAEAETLLKQARAVYPNDQTIAKLAGDSAALSQGWQSISVERK
jgi:Flp pilus assembly protein TadD